MFWLKLHKPEKDFIDKINKSARKYFHFLGLKYNFTEINKKLYKIFLETADFENLNIELEIRKNLIDYYAVYQFMPYYYLILARIAFKKQIVAFFSDLLGFNKILAYLYGKLDNNGFFIKTLVPQKYELLDLLASNIQDQIDYSQEYEEEIDYADVIIFNYRDLEEVIQDIYLSINNMKYNIERQYKLDELKELKKENPLPFFIASAELMCKYNYEFATLYTIESAIISSFINYCTIIFSELNLNYKEFNNFYYNAFNETVFKEQAKNIYNDYKFLNYNMYDMDAKDYILKFKNKKFFQFQYNTRINRVKYVIKNFLNDKNFVNIKILEKSNDIDSFIKEFEYTLMKNLLKEEETFTNYFKKIIKIKNFYIGAYNNSRSSINLIYYFIINKNAAGEFFKMLPLYVIKEKKLMSNEDEAFFSVFKNYINKKNKMLEKAYCKNEQDIKYCELCKKSFEFFEKIL